MSARSTAVLDRQEEALLHAVADDRCEILHPAHPVLFVDGRLCGDLEAGRRLIEAGLVAQPGLGSGRWPARLTRFGRAVLARLDTRR